MSKSKTLKNNEFIKTDVQGSYAGTHLLIDVCDASKLDDAVHIEQTLTQCAQVTGATLLHLHSHIFTPNGGVSAVAVLAESHISIHSWPEINYAAMDVFMCGDTQPLLCIDIIKKAFETDNVQVQVHKRGLGVI